MTYTAQVKVKIFCLDGSAWVNGNFLQEEEPQIKLPTSVGSSKKAREFQKNIYFCFIDYAKAFDCVDHHKLWKILKEMAVPDHLPAS